MFDPYGVGFYLNSRLLMCDAYGIRIIYIIFFDPVRGQTLIEMVSIIYTTPVGVEHVYNNLQIIPFHTSMLS